VQTPIIPHRESGCLHRVENAFTPYNESSKTGSNKEAFDI
jgi:hypothetical protein